MLEVYRDRVKSHNDTGILIVVDGAAFGAFYDSLRNVVKQVFNTVIYLPESFEYVLLSSELFAEEGLSEKLNSTYDYADSAKYMTWEQYYTDLLKTLTDKTELVYTKSKLNPAYLIPDNFKTISKLFVDELGLK